MREGFIEGGGRGSLLAISARVAFHFSYPKVTIKTDNTKND